MKFFINLKMKKHIFYLMVFISLLTYSQGKYAEKYKSLINKKYFLEKDIKALKSFQYRGGNVIGNMDELGQYHTVFEIFTTKSTAVVLFSKLINVDTKQYVVLDVLYFSKMPKNFEIKTFGCSFKNQNPDEPIVAAVKPNGKTVLLAYQLKDIKFNSISIKNIKCINEIDN